MSEEILSHSETETLTLAASLAKECRPGFVVALQGDLGTGKTVFARGMVQALTHAEEVTSPTFTLMHLYDAMLPGGYSCPLWHCDLYRLQDAREVHVLGLHEAAEQGILIIEWPRLALEFLTPDVIVSLYQGSTLQARRITIERTST